MCFQTLTTSSFDSNKVEQHDSFMRTPVTLDADVLRQVRREMRRTRRSFKEVLNSAVRAGLRDLLAQRRRSHSSSTPGRWVSVQASISRDSTNSRMISKLMPCFSPAVPDDHARGTGNRYFDPLPIVNVLVRWTVRSPARTSSVSRKAPGDNRRSGKTKRTSATRSLAKRSTGTGIVSSIAI